MELCFDAILHSKLGNENSDAGHIKCWRGSHVPHPCCKQSVVLFVSNTIGLVKDHGGHLVNQPWTKVT